MYEYVSANSFICHDGLLIIIIIKFKKNNQSPCHVDIKVTFLLFHYYCFNKKEKKEWHRNSITGHLFSFLYTYINKRTGRKIIYILKTEQQLITSIRFQIQTAWIKKNRPKAFFYCILLNINVFYNMQDWFLLLEYTFYALIYM